MKILGCDPVVLIWLCLMFLSFWIGYWTNGQTYKTGYDNGSMDELENQMKKDEENEKKEKK